MASEGTYEVTGLQDFARVAGNLKEAGERDLRLAMLRGLRESGKPLAKEAQNAARENLPHTGGLNEWVAGSAKFTIRTATGGRNPSIRLVGAQKGHDLNAMDRGRLRHPTYGKGKWVTQNIDAGWFSEHMESAAVAPVKREILNAMEDVVRRVARGG